LIQTKLFSDLYLATFLDTSAKRSFIVNNSLYSSFSINDWK